MADKLGLGTEVRELKLGTSFTNPKESTFYTLRYDFKPASVDINKMATIDVGVNKQITVNVPPNTVFKGSAKPYQKQCIIIVNSDTGEITLEKLSDNIQVKKTRSENKKITSQPQKMPTIDQFTASQKAKKQSSTKNSSSHSSKSNPAKGGGKTKLKSQHLAASLGSLVPKHSPLHASPNRKSPNPVRFSPNQQPSNASLPSIGCDDNFTDNWFQNGVSSGFDLNKDRYTSISSVQRKNPAVKTDIRNRSVKHEPEMPPAITIDKPKPTYGLNENVGDLSDSSTSSSSSSGDSSDSSSDSEEAPKKMGRPNGPPNSMVPENLLKEDLQLSSESGSESD